MKRVLILLLACLFLSGCFPPPDGCFTGAYKACYTNGYAWIIEPWPELPPGCDRTHCVGPPQ